MNQEDERRQMATRDSWKSIAMPEQRGQLPFQRVFTQPEFERVSFGLIPAAMEDKWFIFYEDQSVYFHRSWTGFCVYQLQLEQADDNWEVKETWINRNNEQYKSESRTDEYDMKLLAFLIDNLLLGKRDPFPLPNNLPANMPPGAYQHHIVGTGYAEKPIVPKDSLLERLKKLFPKR